VTTLRRAIPEDAAACVLLRGRTRQNAVSAERLRAVGITAESWAADIASGTLPGWVAHESGADGEGLVGYCFGHPATGEVIVLALLPEAEGRGLGKQLLDRVVANLRAAGHGRLFLGCSADPATRSHGFYRHLGWRSTGRFDAHGDEVLELLTGAGRAQAVIKQYIEPGSPSVVDELIRDRRDEAARE
jgi:GNAT superfamily N-acetyltransferase